HELAGFLFHLPASKARNVKPIPYQVPQLSSGFPVSETIFLNGFRGSGGRLTQSIPVTERPALAAQLRGQRAGSPCRPSTSLERRPELTSDLPWSGPTARWDQFRASQFSWGPFASGGDTPTRHPTSGTLRGYGIRF